MPKDQKVIDDILQAANAPAPVSFQRRPIMTATNYESEKERQRQWQHRDSKETNVADAAKAAADGAAKRAASA